MNVDAAVADEPLVQVLSRAYARVHGEGLAMEATTATTDGIPALCFGPRAERIHGIDERVSLSSMVECARVLAHFVLDWCEDTSSGGALAHAGQGGEEHGHR